MSSYRRTLSRTIAKKRFNFRKAFGFEYYINTFKRMIERERHQTVKLRQMEKEARSMRQAQNAENIEKARDRRRNNAVMVNASRLGKTSLHKAWLGLT